MPITDTFEVNFSKLAETALRSRSPRMMDRHYVGFQALDKTEDEKHAVGTAAFVINKVWLYVPVFYINNQIKGMRQALIKHRRIVVPLSDKWINTIEEQGRDVLGDIMEAVDDEDEQKGESTEDYAGVEDIDLPDEISTMSKVSSMDKESVKDWLVGELGRGKNASWNCPDLLTVLKEAGAEPCVKFMDWVMKDASFANSLFKFYSEGELARFAAEVSPGAAPKTAKDDDKDKGLELIDLDVMDRETAREVSSKLDGRGRKILFENGFYLNDTRGPEELSGVFRFSGGGLAGYTQPADRGYGHLLLRDGKTEEVRIYPLKSGEVLIKSAEGKDWGRGGPDRFMVTYGLAPIDTERKLREKLPRASEQALAGLVPDGEYKPVDVALHTPRESSVVTLERIPGEGVRVARASDSKKSYDDYKLPGGDYPTPGRALSVPDRALKESEGKGALGGRMEGFYNLPADTVYEELKSDNQYRNLATDVTVVNSIRLDSSWAPLTVRSTPADNKVIVETPSMKMADSPKKVITWLADQMGIQAGSARSLVKNASADGDEYFIRLGKSASIEEERDGTRAPGVREDSNPDEEKEEPIDGDKKIRDKFLDQAGEAAEQGIREVFDVNVLRALFATGDIEQEKNDAIKKWAMAMDSAGRYLLTVYWNYDKFEENFGAEDMEIFESSANETFESLGDLVLFVREKLTDSEAEPSYDIADEEYGDVGDLG